MPRPGSSSRNRSADQVVDRLDLTVGDRTDQTSGVPACAARADTERVIAGGRLRCDTAMVSFTSVPAGSRGSRRVVWVLWLMVAVVAIWWLWRSQTTTWPPELDPPRSETLFADSSDPTADDLMLLAALVAEIAQSDPVVIDLLGGRPWPEPEIGPVYWIGDGRVALTGGSFRLELDEVDYEGPWPVAGCRGGRYRGTVQSVDAVGLTEVFVVVDLTFERVTRLSIPPPAPPTDQPAPAPPVVRYGPDQEDAPWYTGRCRRFSFGG